MKSFSFRQWLGLPVLLTGPAPPYSSCDYQVRFSLPMFGEWQKSGATAAGQQNALRHSQYVLGER